MHEYLFCKDLEPDKLALAGQSIRGFFGMSREPFLGEPDEGKHYSNAEIRETYRSLIASIAERPGLFLLTGPAGVGKSCLLRRLCAELQGAGHLVISHYRAGRAAADLLATVCESVGIGGATGKALKGLEPFRLQLAYRGGPPVLLVIDEGERLGGDVLAALAALLGSPGPPDTALRILLCGHPGLSDRLDLPVFGGVTAKLVLHCRLEPLSDADAATYIFHRLRGVGCRGTELFTPAAIDDIVAHTAGLPRRIDLLCFRSLLQAAVALQPVVTATIVAGAIDASSPKATAAFVPRAPAKPARRGRLVLAASLAAGALTAGIFAYSFDRWVRAAAVADAAPTSRDDGNRRPQLEALESVAALVTAAAADAPAINLVSAAVAVDQAGVADDRGLPAVAETAVAPQGGAAPVASPDAAMPVADAAPIPPVASPPVETAAETRPNAAAMPEPAREAATVVPESKPAPAGAAAAALESPPVAPLPVVGSPGAPAPVAALPVVGSPPARPSDAAPLGASAAAAAPPAVDPLSAKAEPPAAPSPDSRAELRSGDAAATGASAKPERPAATVPRPSAAELAALIDRGDRLLAIGDIAAARLFYERAAESGSARAATSLGKTYDPVFFRHSNALGIRPDAAVAASWYRRAAEMGDSVETGSSGDPTTGSGATGGGSSAAAGAPPAAPERPAATVPRPSAAELATLTDRGDQLLAVGDIAAARLFYERAAESGSARATTSLGKTYDPVFFRHSSAVGIRPDAAVAAAWYRRAAEMGDSEAPARLHSLDAFTTTIGDASGGKAGQRRQADKGGGND